MAEPTFSKEMMKYAKSIFDEISRSEDGINKFCKTQGVSKLDDDNIRRPEYVGDFNHFLQYLTSPMADAMAPASIDTSYPLSDYFISSSHNTYLWGNQLYGQATADAYQNVRRYSITSW